MKKCNSCGAEKPREEFYKLSSPKYKSEWDCRDSLCKTCRIAYSNERRRKTKEQAVEYKGGKCLHCEIVGPSAIYDFHHLDPNKKDFSPGKSTKKFESIKQELDKCILLCANCHRIIHYKEDS